MSRGSFRKNDGVPVTTLKILQLDFYKTRIESLILKRVLQERGVRGYCPGKFGFGSQEIHHFCLLSFFLRFETGFLLKLLKVYFSKVTVTENYIITSERRGGAVDLPHLLLLGVLSPEILLID